MIVTIGATTVNASTNFPGSTCTLRIYSSIGFTPSDGTFVMDGRTGSFYKPVSCTISAGVISIPSFTIPSTTDGLDYFNARYTAIFYDSKNIKRDIYFDSFQVPITFGATVTWAQLRVYKVGRQPIRDLQTYTKEEVNALIALAAGTLNDASDVVKGRAYSDVAPAIASAPTFVALNSRRTLSLYSVTATAIGATGNGTTNDRAALNTLANTTLQIAGAGGDIYFSPGDYSIQSNMTFPANVRLNFDPRARLKPANGVTITILGDTSSWDSHQKFTNALAGQGTIAFSTVLPDVRPEWWATNTTPGTTDMTTAVQAAITATAGRGRVLFSSTSYLITARLTLPEYSGTTFSPLVLEGKGPFLTSLVNKAPASNPTLLINRAVVIIKGLGFWGSVGFPNDAIKISGDSVVSAGRVYIQDNAFFPFGNAIYLEKTHSVWIQNNYGSVSGGSILAPPGATLGWTFGATAAFVFAELPTSGFVNHIIIKDNMSEGFNYPVYVNQSGSGAASMWEISGNQFEGSTNGIKLTGIFKLTIKDNYLGEGTTGYAIDLDNCRQIDVDNYIHLNTVNSLSSTVKLNNVLGGSLGGYIPRLYITSNATGYGGLTFSGGQVDRLQDETSDHLLSMSNVIVSLAVPRATFNMTTGRSTWYSDTTSTVLYPTVRDGDQILKVNSVAGASPGWVATTASSAGALVQVTGAGPDPTVLDDYAEPVAYDFRITVLTGGVTGTATYKVEWKTAGGGVYADLTGTITTTELAYLIERSVGSGDPTMTFAIRWPTGVTYVSGDQWTLTAVVAPIWKAQAALAA